MNSDNPYGNNSYGAGAYQQSAPTSGMAAQNQSTEPLSGSQALVFDVTTEGFGPNVMEKSRQVPVIVDFWAPWCGPCKQLTPVLERAIEAQGGKVLLAKMNIDEHPAIAGQMGVQSIPAVVAFVDGQPADAFMGSVPESEAKAFVEKIAKLGGDVSTDPVGDMLEAAKGATEGERHEEAGQLYSAILQANPENIQALAGLASALFALGRTDDAKKVLEQVPSDKRNDALFTAIDAKMKLAEEVAALGDPDALKARIEKDPKDYEARYDLAAIYNMQEDRAAAADALLTIIQADRAWNDEAARVRLLSFFDAWGPMDPATLAARRKLSSLLFS